MSERNKIRVTGTQLSQIVWKKDKLQEVHVFEISKAMSNNSLSKFSLSLSLSLSHTHTHTHTHDV